MPRELMDEVVETDYGQLELAWADEWMFDGDFDRVYADQVNGLVGAAWVGGIYVSLARRSGGSRVIVQLHEGTPDVDTAWEDVVEVSFLVPDGERVAWVSWAGESRGDVGLGAGSYRLRVSATGRDAGQTGEFAEEVVDTYLLDVWPAPFALDAIVKVTSQDAAYWHSVNGGRR